ncbi:MAG: ribbon-helix-helix domain-containing protein [Rhodospirillales bacterium]|nr:ribbon-helix-helix domain-containing protein [Rhodospirillales bacterium]
MKPKHAASRLVNRNVVAGRGRTSMRLEPELWDALHEVCRRERQDMSELVRAIEARGHAGGRTSAVRVFLLQYFRAAASEAGHLAAGHGPSEPPAARGQAYSRAAA